MAFVLASASPRRLDLLIQIDRRPDIVEVTDIDESLFSGERPNELVNRLAIAKARVIAAKYPNDVVLGADTVVACGRRILTKPKDASEAYRSLSLLSGRRHRVYGGIALVSPKQTWQRSVVTQVVFNRLTEADIQCYVDSNEWQGKAGGYGIQGRAGVFVRRINGSYTNVVGLCVHTIEPLLKVCLGSASAVSH